MQNPSDGTNELLVEFCPIFPVKKFAILDHDLENRDELTASTHSTQHTAVYSISILNWKFQFRTSDSHMNKQRFSQYYNNTMLSHKVHARMTIYENLVVTKLL